MKIETYIQFAIDNVLNIDWYNIRDYDIDYWGEIILFTDNTREIYLSKEKLITSKPFIEAIARGKIKPLIEKWIIKKEETLINRIINEVTIAQAFAIRDDKLEEYIINLWIEWKTL